MRARSTHAVLILALSLACTEEEPPPPLEDVPMSGMAHGDHNPKYGGTVWMHGDLHFEVVLDPGGKHHVYFSDAYRVELPAAVASDVKITILRSEGEPEPLELTIDEFGESWVADGKPVDDPEALAIVSFDHESGPYEIELPFLAQPVDPNAPDPHKMPPEG